MTDTLNIEIKKLCNTSTITTVDIQIKDYHNKVSHLTAKLEKS